MLPLQDNSGGAAEQAHFLISNFSAQIPGQDWLSDADRKLLYLHWRITVILAKGSQETISLETGSQEIFYLKQGLKETLLEPQPQLLLNKKP